jgi:putative transposase
MAPRVLLQLMEMMLVMVRTIFAGKADLALENLALRQQLAALKRKQPRPRLDDFDRAFWAAMKGQFANWADALVIVKPETVVRWHKEAFRKHWAKKSAHPPGRPGVPRALRDLIWQMASENQWGAPRIHAELLKLGLELSQATVSRYLPKRPPTPDQVERWKAFLRNHLPDLAAMDFFTIPTASFKVLYGFFIIRHDRRHIIHINVTEHPTALWVILQLREAFPFDQSVRHLIHDRDTIFCQAVRGWLSSAGIKPTRTAYHSPWQNGICERFVGTLRRELLDRVVILGEAHARRLLADYCRHYHQDRCHLGLDKDCPEPRPVQPRPPGNAKVVALLRVGGLHHRYEWKQAA